MRASIKKDLLALALLLTAAWVLGFLGPALTAFLFNRIVPNGRFGMLTGILLALALLTVLQQGVDLLAIVYRTRLHARLSYEVKGDRVRHLLSLPASFFRKFSVAELITRAAIADGEQERLSVSVFSALLAAMFAASNAVVLAFLDPEVLIVSLVTAGFAVTAGTILSLTKLKLERCIHGQVSALRSFLFQLFSGISSIRTASSERWLFFRWSRLFEQRQELASATLRLSAVGATIQEALPIFGLALAFWVIGRRSSVMTHPGTFLAAITAFGGLMAGSARFCAALSDFANLLPLMERAEPILTARPEARADRSLSLSGKLEFRNVSFRYSDSLPLLDQVNFTIDSGQFVAIVGPSGSGKSTLIRLLLGFEEPLLGEVRFDDVPLSELDPRAIRQQIGTVLQQDQLIPGTIEDNIKALRPISVERVWEATRLAGLSADLERWPMGIKTVVTNSGAAFSGGERQRIMIARALASSPRILLLDEATSALDNETQAEVMKRVGDLGITRVVIAHRLSTVRHADKIVALSSWHPPCNAFANTAKIQGVDGWQ